MYIRPHPFGYIRMHMDSPLDSVYLIFPKYVRMRDSFAFLLMAKIIVSPPSSWRRPSCHRQLGFYFRIPHLCKIKTRYPNGYLHFLCLLNTIDAILDFYNLLCTSVHIHSDASGCTWILFRFWCSDFCSDEGFVCIYPSLSGKDK